MRSIEDVLKFMEDNKLLLVTAESCTAGLVASIIAEHPGCGSIFEGGFVVYSEQAKQQCLGVSESVIKEFGLTSEEVACELARGALSRTRANLALGITGTAESDDELCGVVCFSYAISLPGNNRVLSETIRFKGDRNAVRKAAAEHALLAIPDYFQRLQIVNI